MIEVWLGRTALTVRGHAGFSRYGSDIVCAAASMLAFALAEAVQAAGMKTPPVIESTKEFCEKRNRLAGSSFIFI